MDRARWDRLERICAQALDLDGAEHEAFLQRACGDDQELRSDIDSLLRQLQHADSFLERPIVDLAAITQPGEGEEAPPDAIGPYRVERLLGRGGMGEVYLGVRETEDIRQRVAIKVIRRGMATDEVLQRFRLERRILASLQHRNIARLLDAAATADGRPYFVMEYVEGAPITTYCDTQRLKIRERLILFRTVCKAVEAAHQALVVHRDLKPRNILVAADGTPVLLDFGIGKVLAPTEALGAVPDTSADMRLLTPEYASPEQVRGDAVTTASDVYALGILLFELLTGRHPYLSGSEARADVERAVLDAPPTRPSLSIGRSGDTPVSASEISQRRATTPRQLQRRLAGDLDNIVLMALRKEPARRYPSAAALADDVERYLDGLPVRAQPDTLGYRTRKFVRRHAASVAASAVMLLALGAITVVTFVQSGRVARESRRVLAERDKAIEVRGFLMEMFGASGANRAVGDTVTARRLLDLQVAQVRTSYADRPELRAEMLEVLADGYDRLGLYAEAEPLAREALAERRRMFGERHPDVASSLNMVGWIMHERGQSREAEPLLREAVALRRAAGENYRADLARSLNDLGVVYNELRRYANADTVLTEALAIRRSLFSDGHRAVGITANNLAAAAYYQGDFASASRVQELAVTSLQQAVGQDHQRTVVALGNLAFFRRAAGDWRGAESTFRELLARQTRLQGADHPVAARVRASLAQALYDRATADGNDAALVEAEQEYRHAIASLERTLGPNHPEIGTSLDRFNTVLLARKKLAEALQNQERALAILRAAHGDSGRATIAATGGLALIHFRRGDVSTALRIQRDVVRRYAEQLGAASSQAAFAQGRLCEYLLATSNGAADAARACETAERTQRQSAPAAARLTGLRLARAYISLGRIAAADSILARLTPGIDSLPARAPERALRDSLLAQRGSRAP